MIRILGFGNILITGLQGAGKSHFVMSQIVQVLNEKPDFNIYLANIDGVKLESPNLHIVEPTFSWIDDAPHNSIIVYDETGMIDRFNNSSRTINSNPEVQQLTMARHQGKTILFIAQDSSIVHHGVRRLLTRHFHFSNPYNDPEKTHCFVFPQVQDRLDGQNKTWKKNAIEEFKHDLDPDIFPLYKSVDDGAKHNKKKQFNPKAKKIIIGVAIMAIFLIPIFIYAITGAIGFYQKKTNKNSNQVVQEKTSTVANTISPATAQQQQSEMIEQSNANYVREQQLYKERLPDDYQILSNNDDLRVSGVIKMKGRCLAYNAKGERLNITASECNYYINNQGSIIKSGIKNSLVTQHNELQQQTVEPHKQI